MQINTRNPTDASRHAVSRGHPGPAADTADFTDHASRIADDACNSGNSRGDTTGYALAEPIREYAGDDPAEHATGCNRERNH